MDLEDSRKVIGPKVNKKRKNDGSPAPLADSSESHAEPKPKVSKTTSSKFRGVSWDKRDQKWTARIKIDGNITHLGYFEDEDTAARKFDEHAARLGRPLNFHSAGQVQVTHTSSTFLGVTWSIRAQKWLAEVLINDHQSHFCICENEESAAQKYDEHAARYGRLLNFPTKKESHAASYLWQKIVDIAFKNRCGTCGMGGGGLLAPGLLLWRRPTTHGEAPRRKALAEVVCCPSVCPGGTRTEPRGGEGRPRNSKRTNDNNRRGAIQRDPDPGPELPTTIPAADDGTVNHNSLPQEQPNSPIWSCTAVRAPIFFSLVPLTGEGAHRSVCFLHASACPSQYPDTGTLTSFSLLTPLRTRAHTSPQAWPGS